MYSTKVPTPHFKHRHIGAGRFLYFPKRTIYIAAVVFVFSLLAANFSDYKSNNLQASVLSEETQDVVAKICDEEIIPLTFSVQDNFTPTSAKLNLQYPADDLEILNFAEQPGWKITHVTSNDTTGKVNLEMRASGENISKELVVVFVKVKHETTIEIHLDAKNKYNRSTVMTEQELKFSADCK